MNQHEVASSAREAAITSLAVVGFIALVAGGIWLAIYSTRFVPAAVDGIGAAAVYLGSVFTPNNDDGGLVVVDNGGATTTIPFDNATTTDNGSDEPAPVNPGSGNTQPGTPTTVTVGAPTSLYGLADLQVSVTAVGYLDTSSTNSFVPSATAPRGERPAVKFRVTNTGTNVASAWRFTADLPQDRNFRNSAAFDDCEDVGGDTQRCESHPQQSLQPGAYIDYTLGFEQPDRGESQEFVIRVDTDDQVLESNEGNNTARATIDVR